MGRFQTLGSAVWVGLLGFVLAAPAAGLLIEVPLWKRVENSEVIVLAKVLSVETEPAPPEEIEQYKGTFTPEELERSHALLEVQKFLKGRAPKLILVHYQAGFNCPAPAGYMAGREVTTFLNLIEGQWVPYGLALGTLYEEGETRADLHAMIRSAVALQSGKVKGDYRDWLVEEVIRPGTRDDGLETLLPDTPNEPVQLEERHLRHLAAAFVADPPEEWDLVRWLRLLEPWPDPAVDQAAIRRISEGLPGKNTDYWLTDAMYQLFRHQKRENAWKLVERAIDLARTDPAALVAFWREVSGSGV